jgi:hyperosmotically inducible periplasmic protein
MNNKACAFLLVFFALVSVCLAKDPVPVTDDTVRDRVLMKLATDQVVKGGALQVDVKAGVVTLGGQVEQPKQKTRATKVAKKVKGVKQVVNNITLRDKTVSR